MEIYQKNQSNMSAVDIASVVWFIFDNEGDLRSKWNEYYAIIKSLRKINSYVKVRMLMTKGCIEYFFLLHYEKSTPQIAIPADKDRVENKLRDNYCITYKKGDKESTEQIAKNYLQAIENGKWSLNQIKDELGCLEVCDERDKKLFLTDKTFSNVFEGIEWLEKL